MWGGIHIACLSEGPKAAEDHSHNSTERFLVNVWEGPGFDPPCGFCATFSFVSDGDVTCMVESSEDGGCKEVGYLLPCVKWKPLTVNLV